MKITHMIEKGFKVSFGNLLRVFYPKRTGSGIPGIGKRSKILLSQPLIVFFKTFLTHHYFAPDFDLLDSIIRKRCEQWHGTDLLEVGGYLLAFYAISPGCAWHQQIIFVNQGN